jgi:hypothetical protein
VYGPQELLVLTTDADGGRPPRVVLAGTCADERERVRGLTRSQGRLIAAAPVNCRRAQSVHLPSFFECFSFEVVQRGCHTCDFMP